MPKKKKKSKINYSNTERYEQMYQEEWGFTSDSRDRYGPWQSDYRFSQENYNFPQQHGPPVNNWFPWRNTPSRYDVPPENRYPRRTLLPHQSRSSTNHFRMPQQPMWRSYSNPADYRFADREEFGRNLFQHRIAPTSHSVVDRAPNTRDDRESSAGPSGSNSHTQHFNMPESQRVGPNRNPYTAKLRSASRPVARVTPVKFTSIPVSNASLQKLSGFSVASATNSTASPVATVSSSTSDISKRVSEPKTLASIQVPSAITTSLPVAPTTNVTSSPVATATSEISKRVSELTTLSSIQVSSATTTSLPVATVINITSPVATVSSATSNSISKRVSESTTLSSIQVSSATTASLSVATTLSATSSLLVATVTPAQSSPLSFAILPLVQPVTTRNEVGENDCQTHTSIRNSSEIQVEPVVSASATPLVSKQSCSNDECQSALNAKKCSSDEVEYLYTVEPDDGKLIEVLDLSDDKGSKEVSRNRNLILSSKNSSSNKNLEASNKLNKPPTEQVKASTVQSRKRKREENSATHCVVCHGDYEGIVSNNDNLLFSSKCGHLFCMACLKDLVKYKCTECNGAISNLRKVIK